MGKSVRKFKETLEFRSNFIKRLRSHRYFPLIVLIGAFLVIACFHVWQRVHVMKLVHEVSLLRQHNIELLDHYKKVNSDISALMMTSRIEKIALDSLGLEQVSADRLFTLVKKPHQDLPPDELSTMLSSIKRVAEYMPVITGNNVHAGETGKLRIDSNLHRSEGR